MSRLKKRYNEVIKSELKEQFEIGNVMQVPKLKKIVINMGIAEVTKEKNLVQDHKNELEQIAGQKPIICPARKSEAAFKLREGMPVGIKVTLRGTRMYDFVDRFCNVAAPRVRDFRGFPTKGDGRGNYTLGLDDQQMFVELNLDKVKRSQGMHITFVTSAENDEQGIELLRQLGMPFKDKEVIIAPAA